jgi:hypothetical protein
MLMTSRDFCYWLQGYFEIIGTACNDISPEQANIIRKHLALVFIHEIDPSMGPQEHQDALNAVHSPPKKPYKPNKIQLGEYGPNGEVRRC